MAALISAAGLPRMPWRTHFFEGAFDLGWVLNKAAFEKRETVTAQELVGFFFRHEVFLSPRESPRNGRVGFDSLNGLEFWMDRIKDPLIGGFKEVSEYRKSQAPRAIGSPYHRY